MRVHPTSTAMLRTVVNHVAALAERCQLVKRAVAGIMIEMRAGQDHRCPFSHLKDVLSRSTNTPAVAVTPIRPAFVPPASVSEVEDPLPMWAPAMFAASACPYEADQMR